MATACNSSGTNRLLRRASNKDEQALAELFARCRERLRRMIRLRLDRRLKGRFQSSTVMQMTFEDAVQRFPDYVANPTLPFFLWLRLLAGQRVQALHRQHLGSQVWDEGQAISLYHGALPQANSVSLAAQLLGHMTAAAQAGAKAEMQLKLQDALNGMDPVDREVLALRHFEELGNDEAALVLGLDPAAASGHFIRALKRLKEILNSVPGFFDHARGKKKEEG